MTLRNFSLPTVPGQVVLDDCQFQLFCVPHQFIPEKSSNFRGSDHYYADTSILLFTASGKRLARLLTFHRGLLTLSGNRRIQQVGLGLRDYAQRAHIVASRLRPIPAASEHAHGELIDLIAAGKVEAARKRHSVQRRSGEVALIGAMERVGIRAL